MLINYRKRGSVNRPLKFKSCVGTVGGGDNNMCGIWILSSPLSTQNRAEDVFDYVDPRCRERVIDSMVYWCSGFWFFFMWCFGVWVLFCFVWVWVWFGFVLFGLGLGVWVLFFLFWGLGQKVRLGAPLPSQADWMCQRYQVWSPRDHTSERVIVEVRPLEQSPGCLGWLVHVFFFGLFWVL